MALFKILEGEEPRIDLQPLNEGWAYFCKDSGKFYIDVNKGTAEAPNIAREHIRTDKLLDANGDFYTVEDFSLKEEADLSVAYTKTLIANNWVANGTLYNYVLNLTTEDLTCGKAGNVPPMIMLVSAAANEEPNQADYNKIVEADANPDTHTITFTANQAIVADMTVVIIDKK